MHANAIEAYKRTLRLTSEQREVIVGKILGDGHLETQNRGRTFRMKIEHGIAQSAYVEWLYKLFRPWALSPPGVKVQMRAGKVNRKSLFQTVSHPAFRFYGRHSELREWPVKSPSLLKRQVRLSPAFMRRWWMFMELGLFFLEKAASENRNAPWSLLNGDIVWWRMTLWKFRNKTSR